MPRILYHYTSSVGYAGILKTKTIWPSLRAISPNDARFGDGQYFSDILPNTERPGQLSRTFLNHPFSGARFSFHIDVDVDGLTVIQGRQYVFVVLGKTPLDISSRLVGHGPNL